MKKILVLLVILFSFMLVSCDEEIVTTTAYDYSQDINGLENELQEQIDSIELQMELLQQRLDNLISVEGINGNTVYYENRIRMLSETVEVLKDTFDETQAPTYMVDEKNEYVDFKILADKLKDKYFGVDIPSFEGQADIYSTIPFAMIVYIFEDTEITLNEVVALMILLAEEISHYEYYVMSSNGIKLSVHYSDGSYSHQIHLTIPTTVLINSMFTVNADSILSQDFEIVLTTPNEYDIIDKALVQQYYDAYILAKSYDGYVLDLQ